MTTTTEGERRRDDAHAAITARRAHWVRFAQREFARCLLGEPAGATADRVSDLLPLAIRRHCLGAAVRGLAKAGVIVPTGKATSSRPTRHACTVRIWRIADPAAARRWADAHPLLADPESPAEQCLLFSVHEHAF